MFFKRTTADKTKKTTTERIHQLNELHLLLKKKTEILALPVVNQKQDFLKSNFHYLEYSFWSDMFQQQQKINAILSKSDKSVDLKSFKETIL